MLVQAVLPSISQFLKFPCFYILPDEEDCLSGWVYVLQRGGDVHQETIFGSLSAGNTV